MTLEQVYLVASALVILWTGCIWSSNGGLNLVIKTGLISTALLGAVLVSRSLAL